MAFDATEIQAWLRTACDCPGYRGQLRRPRHECGRCITKALQRAYDAAIEDAFRVALASATNSAILGEKSATDRGRQAWTERVREAEHIAAEIRALTQTKGEG